MILGSYNLENLFDRPKVMNQPSASNVNRWQGGQTLSDFAEFNALISKAAYSGADKTRVLELLSSLGLDKSDDGPFVTLRQNRGHLLTRHKDGTISVVATGRSDWIGWLDLLTEPADYTATRNTGQVIRDVNADILAVVEAESRLALSRFSGTILPEVQGRPYDHVMLIEGNDERGINVGIMTRSAYPIESIESHVDDSDTHGTIFSRDCPVYRIQLKQSKHLCILINHLKSKGYGDQTSNDGRRLRQAERVRAIYNGLIAGGHELLAVVGDFNDTPSSASLAPLCGAGSPLKDVFELPGFKKGDHDGTFGDCPASEKIDYILLSPKLQTAFKKGGVFRMGVWGGKKGDMWPHYAQMKQQSDAASDHAAVWAELDL